MGHLKEKLGHTTIDLGVAPDKIETHENGEVTVINSVDKLKSVRGFLVSYPLEFMRHEDLRPAFIESEFYTSPQVFY
jgi:phospholipase D1/2